MKILLVGKTLGKGGTSRYTINLVRSLRPKLSFDFINLDQYYNLPGKYSKRLGLILEFPRQLDYGKYDLIHFLEFDYSVYGILKRVRRRKESVKIIKTSHGMARLEEIFNGIVGRLVLRRFSCYLQEYVQKNADAIIYVSDDQRELFVREFGLDREKTYVSYLASSFSPYHGKVNDLIKAKEKTILFAGRIETRKRIEWFFAMARLMPDFTFKITGHVSDHVYFERLMNLKPKNVKILTDVSDEELIKHYQKARYFVSFSKWENCPVTYLESISQGTPVIAYSMPIKRMIMNECGYQVQTPTECVDKIAELERGYDSLVQRTLDTARLFSWDKTAERTLQIYKDVLDIT